MLLYTVENVLENNEGVEEGVGADEGSRSVAQWPQLLPAVSDDVHAAGKDRKEMQMRPFLLIIAR